MLANILTLLFHHSIKCQLLFKNKSSKSASCAISISMLHALRALTERFVRIQRENQGSKVAE